MTIGRQLKSKLYEALEALAWEFAVNARDDTTAIRTGYFNGVSFTVLARKVCPLAQPKHLRMFENWLEDYSSLPDDMEELQGIEAAAAEFQKNQSKPVLPDSEVQALEREFTKVDMFGNGYISVTDLCGSWGWSDEMAHSMLSSFDIGSDGCIDKLEFMRMMCPEEYRLPEMSGPIRAMFGQFLNNQVNEKRKRMGDRTSRFTDGSQASGGQAKELPNAIFPVVDDELWNQWMEVFDSLDKNSDGTINAKELVSSGLLSVIVARFFASHLDPEDRKGFTRKGFLNAMLKAHELRAPPGFDQT
jgi:Ca2+-binding EF-hand superfamily protein